MITMLWGSNAYLSGILKLSQLVGSEYEYDPLCQTLYEILLVSWLLGIQNVVNSIFDNLHIDFPNIR